MTLEQSGAGGASHFPQGRLASYAREFSLALLIGLAILLGGGGSPAPAPELALQILSAIIVSAAAWSGAFRQRGAMSGAGAAAWLAAGSILVLPFLQLVPLPPVIWQGMPGREPVQAALELIGKDDTWRPLSIAPASTLASMLAMLPPLAILVLAASSPRPVIERAVAVIPILALPSILLGAVQVASGGGAGHFYAHTHGGWVTGFFANRNAAADFFIIALLAGWALGYRHLGTARGRALMVPAALVLLTATLMTGSRTGAVLLVVALAAATVLVIVRRARGSAGRSRRKAALLLGAMLALPGLALAVVLASGGGRAVLARFAAPGDMRADIWPDTVHAVGQFWPVGAGFGTFRDAFAGSERLETIGPAFVNRAHNDYLELALEGGLPAILVLLGVGMLLVRAVWSRGSRQRDGSDLTAFAIAALGVLAIHSLVDYPLRTMALCSLAALAAGILVKPARAS